MVEDFLTWAQLGTWTVLVMAVFVVTQFTKAGIDWLLKRWGDVHVPTRLLAWAWAFILILLALGFKGALDLWGIPLAMLNAVFVALSAMKLYEALAAEVLAKRTASPPAPGA